VGDVRIAIRARVDPVWKTEWAERVGECRITLVIKGSRTQKKEIEDTAAGSISTRARQLRFVNEYAPDAAWAVAQSIAVSPIAIGSPSRVMDIPFVNLDEPACMVFIVCSFLFRLFVPGLGFSAVYLLEIVFNRACLKNRFW
jgi:hypothetical protein